MRNAHCYGKQSWTCGGFSSLLTDFIVDCTAKAARKPRPRRVRPNGQAAGKHQLNAAGVFLLGVLLAALADARPLLLVGPHGTAKSELLNRIARATESRGQVSPFSI